MCGWVLAEPVNPAAATAAVPRYDVADDDDDDAPTAVGDADGGNAPAADGDADVVAARRGRAVLGGLQAAGQVDSPPRVSGRKTAAGHRQPDGDENAAPPPKIDKVSRRPCRGLWAGE